MTSRSQGLRVVVIGQGYVGLPVAVRAVEVGHTVVGIDVDEERIRSLAAGISFVEDVDDASLQQALASGRFQVRTDYSNAAEFEIAVITVPTPLREALPDLSFIESAGRSLGSHLTRGATVVLESTTYPGTTEELLVPLLEESSGLVAGVDFFVGYSPERIDPGNPIWGFTNTPKIISGINTESLDRVRAFYSSMVETTVPVSSPKEAELAKLLENTFRHVNIALVNELAVFAHELGVNLWESIEAASTKPFGYMKFTPGPGVGGHCLPVDPSYLSWQVRRKLGRSFRFIEIANDINDHMPDYVVERAIRVLNDLGKSLRGARILLVGLAYKRDSGDIRESPAVRILELLDGLGANVVAVDPHVVPYRWPTTASRGELTRSAIDSADLAILVTDHSTFDLSILESAETPVLDTRNRVSSPNAIRL